jgi:hypothetical protein
MQDGGRNELVEGLLISFHHVSRDRRGKDDALTRSLMAQLKSEVEQLMKYGQSDSAADGCVMMRLKKGGGMDDEEVVCNTLSSLLAGFETTAILIACTILHLARNSDVQSAARQDVRSGGKGGTMQKILKETLRVNPPVLGLTRTVTDPRGLYMRAKPARIGENSEEEEEEEEEEEGEEGQDSSGEEGACKKSVVDSKEGKIHLKHGEKFIVDFWSIAHGTNLYDREKLER